MVDSESG